MRSLLLTVFLTLIALVAAAALDLEWDHDNTNTTSRFVKHDYVKHDYNCNLPGRSYGNSKDLEKAADWLGQERTKEGKKPKLDGGKCQTASCYKGTKIKWCNDANANMIRVQNKDTKELPSWQNIADGAWVISDWCGRRKNKVMGELNHNDKWRVVAYASDCYMQPGPDGPGSDKD
ncbi:hypothetical protein BDV06DRAFT_216416 [Aspergillus oleicola]